MFCQLALSKMEKKFVFDLLLKNVKELKAHFECKADPMKPLDPRTETLIML